MLDARQVNIPYYEDINEFLASIPVENRTEDPDFYCLRLRKNERALYKPPFRRGFYFVGLLTNAAKTKISYNTTNETNLDSVLVFQAPGLIYSFYKSSDTQGYLIYFKKESLSYFKPEIESEFPFFNTVETDFFKIDNLKFNELAHGFEDVFVTHEQNAIPRITSLKFLCLLYKLKEHVRLNQWNERFTTPQQLLLKKFLALVNTHYIDKRMVEDYADMLSITPNHLSQFIKSTSGKNALAHINARIILEAKSLLQYADLDVAEIAYRLNFSDPANFGKFFKKHTDLTPLDFRKKQKIDYPLQVIDHDPTS
jgi:AraC family transcriptional regulator, transcriptional activator of pobA